MSLAISVIIPALNEEGVIGRSLASLRQQALDGQFEVIVVDNGSRDRTVEVAVESGLGVTVLRKQGASISALRNLGASAAKGEFLAFLDADCLAPSSWLRQGLERLRAPGAGIVGAQYRVPLDSSWVATAWYGDLWRTKNGPVSYVPGGDCFVRRELFLKLGGFDETIATSEDCEFCERAQQAGVSVTADPELSVVHLGTPQTIRNFYRKQLWHGMEVHKLVLRNVLGSKAAKPVLLAAYTLGAGVAVAAGAIAGALYSSFLPLAAGLAVFFAAPALLAARAAVSRHNWTLFAPLTALHTVYGVARAMCLLGANGGRQRPAPQRAQSRQTTEIRHA